MTNLARKFQGVWIPADLWLDYDLSITEKVMLVEIGSLQDKQRGCYASNAHFAEFFGLSISRVSEIISGLAVKDLVDVELIRDGKRVVERRIRIKNPFGKPKTPSENAANPFGKGDEPPSENTQGSNTKESNTGSNQGVPQEGLNRCPYQLITDLFNETLTPALPAVVILNAERKAKLKARWNDSPVHQSVDFWRDYFETVKSSDFLMGRTQGKNGGKPFRASFDWLICPSNFVKVVEGNYHA
ncbi:helix-turn-helix domain-containing protein [Stutzerimonas frequens]|uniref:helix-turn-helix domain-containing protein n=1 Tax=Stutzerimonas frequens TaxID=2968969 RepID=UPI000AFD4C86|nr:helix-turn-helix domain-containing protein [Stutzerimonas frequens]